MVRVRMLGRPMVIDHGEQSELPKGKTSALLWYLAYRGAWVGRDEIVYLFWPDTPEGVARGNLRSLLSRSLRTRRFSVAPEIEPARLRWQVESDSADFRDAVREERWQSAFEAYGGELLAGYPCDDIPQFATWLDFEREALLRDCLQAGGAWIEQLERRGETAAAERVFEALLAVRPENEDLFRRYLHFLERSGHGERADWAFARFRRQLARDLDIEPDTVTVQLLDRVRQSSGDGREPVALPSHNLPAELTRFVGRREERASVIERLRDPDTRLVTILGPGGMGKTRLALACARELLERYPDGVWFVSLDGADDRVDLLYRIADAVGLRTEGAAPLEGQLGDFLATRRLLLVLDSVEEVIPAVPAVEALLRAAPDIDVIATSRALLHLPGERVFELDGLQLPTAEVPPGDAGGYDAVQLFHRCARSSGRGLATSPATVQQVAAICRRVGGMPLAIELAAAWLRLLTPDEILAELERGTEILSSAHPDASNRHRSIRAVFDASWQMLRPGEQRTLARTAVFRGGFDRDAALAVTDAGLPLLAALADKALLRVSPEGRYQRHPLLQQYLAERFAASDALAGTRERHAEHYLGLLDRFAAEGALPAADLENLEAAWRRVIAVRRPELLRGRARALASAFGSRTGTAAELLEAGLELLPAAPAEERASLELELLSALSSALMVTHGFSSPELRRVTDRLEALTRDAKGGPDWGPALWNLWLIRFHSADHDAARHITESMFALAAAHDDTDIELQARHSAWTHACALGALDDVVRHTAIDRLYDPDRHYRLLFLYGGHDARVCAANFEGIALWMLGRGATALERHGLGLAFAEHLDHPFSLTLACAYGATLHCLRHEPEDAALFAERTLEIAERHRFPLGIALGILCRGWSRGQREPVAALPEIDEALAYWQDKRTDFHRPLVLALHAEICLRAERFGEASLSLDDALALARDHRFRFFFPEVLRLRAELLAATGAASDEVLGAFEAAERAAREQSAWALLLRIAAGVQRRFPSEMHRRELISRLEAMPEPPSTATLATIGALLERR